MSAPGHAFERISVIIPTLDEAGNLTALLADVDRGREVETIVVDGGNRAPVITPLPATVDTREGEARVLRVEATDPDGDSLSYDWDLGDGNDATGADVDHVYAAAGTFPN